MINKLALLICLFFLCTLFHSNYSIQNNTKLSINDLNLPIDVEELQDYSENNYDENLIYFYDIKFAYNRLKSMKQIFFAKLTRYNLKMKLNLSESEIFKNFDDLNTVYKYQISCNLCKKTFKTSHYLWLHTTRAHLFEKYNETDMKTNIFWLTGLSEFLDWESIKTYGNRQELDLNKDVYYRFKKCLIFGAKYLDYDGDMKKLYDFCLEFYFEKESKGKIQDFFSNAYTFFFQVLLVFFVIVTIIYYSFAYYIYLDTKNDNEVRNIQMGD